MNSSSNMLKSLLNTKTNIVGLWLRVASMKCTGWNHLLKMTMSCFLDSQSLRLVLKEILNLKSQFSCRRLLDDSILSFSGSGIYGSKKCEKSALSLLLSFQRYIKSKIVWILHSKCDCSLF